MCNTKKLVFVRVFFPQVENIETNWDCAIACLTKVMTHNVWGIPSSPSKPEQPSPPTTEQTTLSRKSRFLFYFFYSLHTNATLFYSNVSPMHLFFLFTFDSIWLLHLFLPILCVAVHSRSSRSRWCHSLCIIIYMIIHWHEKDFLYTSNKKSQKTCVIKANKSQNKFFVK